MKPFPLYLTAAASGTTLAYTPRVEVGRISARERAPRAPQSFAGGGGFSNGLDWAFDSARLQGYRGTFWFPSLDPSVQLSFWTRDWSNRKANWAYNNIGAVRAIIDGLALDEIDTGLWPKPFTTSHAFNLAVKAAWQQQCGFHKAFSSNGENNFFSAQFMMRREIRLRGACFGLKLRAGEAAACPQMHFLPDWQCSSGGTMSYPGGSGKPADGFIDGRRDNPLGRALAWRFGDPQDASIKIDYDAGDVSHYHDPFLIGQKRGVTCLAPVMRQLFSMDDIFRTETAAVRTRARSVYAIERTSADDDGPSLLAGAESVETERQADGSILTIQRIKSPDGDDVDVTELYNGKKIKVLESQKSNESASWKKELLTEIAYATLYPPEYLFSLAGLTQGTLVRMTQQKVQRVVNTIRDFQVIMQMIEEWWPFWLWQNIKRGLFDNVKGGIPDSWWPYVVVRPRDMTVDMGREGAQYDNRISRGLMPSGLYVGMLYGEDEEEFEDQIIRDHYRRQQRNREIAATFGVPPDPIDQIFRPPPGSSAPQSTGSSGSDEDEDKAEEEEDDK